MNVAAATAATTTMTASCTRRPGHRDRRTGKWTFITQSRYRRFMPEWNDIGMGAGVSRYHAASHWPDYRDRLPYACLDDASPARLRHPGSPPIPVRPSRARFAVRAGHDRPRPARHGAAAAG